MSIDVSELCLPWKVGEVEKATLFNSLGVPIATFYNGQSPDVVVLVMNALLVAMKEKR